MRSSSLHLVAKSLELKGLKITGRSPLFLGILFSLLILFSAACGKHKAQVKTPRTTAGPSSSAKRTEPAGQRPRPVPVKPPVQQNAPPAAAVRSPAALPDLGISPGPSIRIGLTTAKEIRVSSKNSYYLQEKIPESTRQLVQGEIQVRVEQEVEEASNAYQIQVASLTRLEAAEELRKKLAEQFSLPAALRENSASGVYQVRIGDFSKKEEAQAFLKTAIEAGYRDAFVVKESLSSGGGGMTLALRGPQKLFRVSKAGYLLLPSSSKDLLFLDGKPYRGFFDLSLNPNSRITVVNQLGMEEYLLGVVPSEISPSYYPEFAALAAQSIAARTYALRNMGKYRSEGYDLTADTRSQAYNGAAAERDATDEAVRQTYGLAIYYQDKLIDAMYMSTCGGRTEDFSNVFDAPPVPYLKSVICAVENDPEANGAAILEGSHELQQIVQADDGSLANRNLELARILGIIEPNATISVEFLASQAEDGELARWVRNTRKVAPKMLTGEPSGAADLSTRAGFLRYAAESLFGAGEIKRRISAADAQYYMSNVKDGGAISGAARFALAYLMQRGLWRPSLDNTVRPDAPILRSEALYLLLRWVESISPGILRKGSYIGPGSAASGESTLNAIAVKGGNRTQQFRLSQELRLFRLDAGRTIPVDSLRLIGNEKLGFHVNPSGDIDFIEVELNPTGAASDRYSPVATWDVTLARSAIAEKARTLAPSIGELSDLKPAQIGNSGRVVQIEVIGSRSSAVINGYKFKNALGLNDTLFTLTREHNPDGSIASFTFHGRGKGHGVGLCQIGAFGMARAGRSYEEILKTYYQGVQIRKAY